MKIEINLKIVFLIILFFFVNRLEIYTIFFIFIVLHEMAHLIVGMIFGFKPKIFHLNPLGVSIEFFNYGENFKRYKRICTYLAGPIFNFIIALIFYYINISLKLKQEIIYTNIIIGIFNLIPILPLDGGKIFYEILKKILDTKKATVIMISASKIILVFLTFSYSILIFKIKNIAIFLVIIYLWYLHFLEEQKAKILIKVYDNIQNMY